jgi:ribosomal protein L37E
VVYLHPQDLEAFTVNHFDNAIDHDREPSDRITCRRCGETGLHWQEIIRSDGVPSHALFNERNRKHICDENGPDADGFEVER